MGHACTKCRSATSGDPRIGRAHCSTCGKYVEVYNCREEDCRLCGGIKNCPGPKQLFDVIVKVVPQDVADGWRKHLGNLIRGDTWCSYDGTWVRVQGWQASGAVNADPTRAKLTLYSPRNNGFVTVDVNYRLKVATVEDYRLAGSEPAWPEESILRRMAAPASGRLFAA